MIALKGKPYSDGINYYVHIKEIFLSVYYRLQPSPVVAHWFFAYRDGIRDKQYCILFEGIESNHLDSDFGIKHNLIKGNKI